MSSSKMVPPSTNHRRRPKKKGNRRRPWSWCLSAARFRSRNRSAPSRARPGGSTTSSSCQNQPYSTTKSKSQYKIEGRLSKRREN